MKRSSRAALCCVWPERKRNAYGGMRADHERAYMGCPGGWWWLDDDEVIGSHRTSAVNRVETALLAPYTLITIYPSISYSSERGTGSATSRANSGVGERRDGERAAGWENTSSCLLTPRPGGPKRQTSENLQFPRSDFS